MDVWPDVRYVEMIAPSTAASKSEPDKLVGLAKDNGRRRARMRRTVTRSSDWLGGTSWVTGDRTSTAATKRRQLGYDVVHPIVDDHSRLADAEFLADAKAATVTISSTTDSRAARRSSVNCATTSRAQ